MKDRPQLPELERCLGTCDPLERLERLLVELECDIRQAGRDVELLVKTGATRGTLGLLTRQ